MDREHLKEIAHARMADRPTNYYRETGYLYNHSLRVTALTGKLQAMEIGESRLSDVAFAGALFHDIGKGLARHNVIGAVIVRNLLSGHVPDEQLDEICAVVEGHPRRTPDTREPNLALALVQDADILDHHGTQEIWLEFLHRGRADENQKTMLAIFERNEKSGMYEEKRRLLNLDSARRIYDERVEFVRGFYGRFSIESEGGVTGEF